MIYVQSRIVFKGLFQAHEAELDAEIARLDALKEDDLEELRRKRLEKMKSNQADKMKKLAIGHGEYTMIEEKEFFDVAKKSEKMVPQLDASNASK